MSRATTGGGTINQSALLCAVMGDGCVTAQYNGAPITKCDLEDNPAAREIGKLGADDLLVTTSADRLSRVHGQLREMTEAALGDVCILCTEVNVAAALVGWDIHHPPDTLDEANPPRFLQLALGITEGSPQELRMDPVQLRAFNLRTASVVLTKLKQRAINAVTFLPLSVRHAVQSGGAVAAALELNEAQDSEYAQTYNIGFGARKARGTKKLAAEMLDTMAEADDGTDHRLRKAQLQAVRS